MDANIGKVIKIPNEFTLVIKPGLAQFVQVGDLVEVFSMAGEIMDPETNTSLGFLSFPKETLTVTSVNEKFYIAQKLERGTMALAPILRDAIVGRPVKLNVDEAQNEHIVATESPIKIGDLVKLVK